MTLEQKIELLREEWRKNPEKRKTIELQVKVLKLGINAPFKQSVEKTKQSSFEDIVRSSLL